ncbi:MAG: hypothetical protein II544_06795, partial [Spirochaetales bacterium]|nr:hypothetical protein [Spirochaetales bacterium]
LRDQPGSRRFPYSSRRLCLCVTSWFLLIMTPCPDFTSSDRAFVKKLVEIVKKSGVSDRFIEWFSRRKYIADIPVTEETR